MYREVAPCAFCGEQVDLRQPEITIRWQGMSRIVLHNRHIGGYEALRRVREITSRALAVASALLLFLALPAMAAQQVPPALTCGNQNGAAFCELEHYFGTWQPTWEVYLGERKVARAQGQRFTDLVYDDDWRIVRVSVPAKDGKLVFEVWVRRNPDTGRAGFRSPKNAVAYVPNRPAIQQVAQNQPP